jgi:two-component system sensor histidine kinase KdpD
MAARERDVRPDPDSLLAAANREGRGKLKIFLGAAPGVGKTYAMLSGAQSLRSEGVEVVVGVVETHGRLETQALLDRLEILPRLTVAYRGHFIEEFDIDGALARRPTLIIVDELAHTNAPESRHPKRFQDVEELLRAGIDVWTAVNIQHLDSLSDVVSKITGVVIRETVPDTVMEKADEIVVVDLTPAELLQRLKDGKVYLPDNARRAVDNFFKLGNLTALRELALRRTADRVDDQMVDYLRQNAIHGAWPTAERILVCVGADRSSENLIRSASRIASSLNTSLIAVTLERYSGETTDEAEVQRLEANMRLAERLGADVRRLVAHDLADEVLSFARKENITQIFIGRSSTRFWSRLRRRSLTEAIIRRASDIAVHVVFDETAPRPPRRFRIPRPRRAIAGFGTAVLSVGGAVAVGEVASAYLKLPNLSMIFLAAVMLSAVTFGVASAITAALLSFLAYNFFFIVPLYTFTIAEPHELFALLIFLLVAGLTGSLAGRVRDDAIASRHRVATTQALYDFSRKLSGTTNLDDVLWVIVTQVAAGLKAQVVLLLPQDGDLEIKTAFPPEDMMGPSEWVAAQWAYTHCETAGWTTGTLPNAQYRFHPIRASRGVIGVIGVQTADRERGFAAEDERALTALIDQGGISIDRTLLFEEAAQSAALAQKEGLRNALLSSVSHDLRTPLASILGSATTLIQYRDKMSESVCTDLLLTIEEEARRLSRFVANLFDMSHIESGLHLQREWVDLGDVANGAIGRARKSFPDREIKLTLAPGLPLVRGDAVLFEQVIFNLLDNADKYTPKGKQTRVEIGTGGGEAIVIVEDEGPGIPPDELERVFEKFYRVVPGDGRPPGTGLGLAIARGVVEAMGGAIHAESPVLDGAGARIVIRVPATETPDLEAGVELEVEAQSGGQSKSPGR